MDEQDVKEVTESVAIDESKALFIVEWSLPVNKVPVTMGGKEMDLYEKAHMQCPFFSKEKANAFAEKIAASAKLLGAGSVTKITVNAVQAGDFIGS